MDYCVSCGTKLKKKNKRINGYRQYDGKPMIEWDEYCPNNGSGFWDAITLKIHRIKHSPSFMP